MKPNHPHFILVALLAGCLTSTALAQTPPAKHHHKKNAGATNDTDAAAAPTTNSAAANAAAQLQTYENAFVPADPWRLMEDKTNYAKGADWVQFEGRVTSVSGDGTVLQGWFGEPLCYLKATPAPATFFLTDFPRHLVVGQFLSRNDKWVALKAGTKDDLPNLNYGKVYVPELTEEQKAQIVANKSKTTAKVLAWQEDLAKQGDAYGQYKMGMRYLNGDGVDKDLAQARDLFTKSSAQGNHDAADALAKMPAP